MIFIACLQGKLAHLSNLNIITKLFYDKLPSYSIKKLFRNQFLVIK